MIVDDILARRLVMLTGKGGVGKSLVAAALGMLNAQRGLKTLVVELSGQNVMSGYLGGKAEGYKVVERGENLYSLSVTMAEGMEEYLTREMHSQKLYRLVFKNAYVSPFINAVPALEDLIYTGKIMDLERETDHRGELVWDRIVVDGPSTGQGVSLLKTPKAIMDMTRVGPMYKNAKLIQDLFFDSSRTQIVLATLAEEMPVNETVELFEELDKMGAPVGPIVVNEVRRHLFDGKEAQALANLTLSTTAVLEDGPREALEGLLTTTRHLHRRERLETHQIGRLRKAIDRPLLFLPRLLSRQIRPKELDFLSDWLMNHSQEMP